MAIRCRSVPRGHRARNLYGRLLRRYPVALLPSLATCVAHLRIVRGIVCRLFAGFEVTLGTLFPDSSRWRTLAAERNVGRCHRLVHRAPIEFRIPFCTFAPNHLLDRRCFRSHYGHRRRFASPLARR